MQISLCNIFKCLLLFLQVVDHLEIFLFGLCKHSFQLFWLFKEKFVFVEVVRNIDQVQVEELLESMLPVSICHPAVITGGIICLSEARLI